MTEPVILVRSHHGGTPATFAQHLAGDAVEAVWESDLSAGRLAAASGILTTVHLDQIAMEVFAPAITALLARRGRVFINGHVLRPFVTGLAPFRPVGMGHRGAFALTPLAAHPVFAGIDRRTLEERRGVAGFYGRGHNPPPEGAIALTGLGPAGAPIDWVWPQPGGGAVFSHAGNDLWSLSDDAAVNARLADNIVAWAAGRTEA